MTRVYILGEARGTYRIQEFIKLLLDNRKRYKVYYDSLTYGNPVLRYLKSLFINPFVILCANVVYINTLNVDANILYELFWAKIFRKKILVDYYVSVYDTVVLDRGWFKETSFLAKLAMLCDKFFHFCGTKLLYLTEDERDYYMRLAGCEKFAEKAEILPLGVERRPQVDCSFVNSGGSELSVCWWGSYQPLHGMDKIIGAAKILSEKNIPVHFFLFGNDAKKGAEYKSKIDENGLSEICFISDDYTFSNGKLAPFLKTHCDVALGAFGDSSKARTVIINKALEACTMGCLVITGRSAGMERYFDRGNSSIFICESTSEGIAETIEQIMKSDRGTLKNRIKVTEECFEKNFEMHLMKERFQAALDSLKKADKA